MIEIIKIERKRILSKKIFLLFLSIIALFSVYDSYSVAKRYSIPSSEGISVTWQENLKHAKENLRGKSINREFLSMMRQQKGEVGYLDERNLEELIYVNYERKLLQDLSDDDIGSFYSRRLSNIRAMLEESSLIRYTQEEIERFMQSAAQVSEISFEYAEGWKILNDDMGVFVALILVLISVLLLPLVGIDTKNNMQELCRGTKYGKGQLDHARIFTAFISGAFLYVVSIFLYFLIKIVPFGLGGWNQCIQSNPNTFFSLYNITNLEQFLLNVMVGFVALLFVIAMLLFITAFMEKIMTSAVIYAFFWIMLLLFDQMYLWQVDHYFANFMPLRMTAFSHYYTGNEIYRVFGNSLSCMTWSILLSGLLTGIMLLLIVMSEKIKRKKGLY